jgi:hypothetical protein
MKDAHSHLNITEKEWDAMVADELIGIVATTKADIVLAPKAGKK